jgi:hypothetical protein
MHLAGAVSLWQAPRMTQGESKPHRLSFTPEERGRWVSRYRSSGQTQAQFAQQHGLKLTTLQWWICPRGRAVGLGGFSRWENARPHRGRCRGAAEYLRAPSLQARIGVSHPFFQDRRFDPLRSLRGCGLAASEDGFGLHGGYGGTKARCLDAYEKSTDRDTEWRVFSGEWRVICDGGRMSLWTFVLDPRLKS